MTRWRPAPVSSCPNASFNISTSSDPRVSSRCEALFQPVTQHQQFIDLGNDTPLSGEGREEEDGVISKSPVGQVSEA